MANHFNDPSLKNFLTHPDDKLSMMVRIGDSDTILGYVAVTAMKDNKEANPTIKTAQISRLTVFPQFRRRGKGKKYRTGTGGSFPPIYSYNHTERL